LFISFAVTGIAIWAWETGWFQWMILGETALAVCVYAVMQKSLASARWIPAE
jgi:hypothetical protein